MTFFGIAQIAFRICIILTIGTQSALPCLPTIAFAIFITGANYDLIETLAIARQKGKLPTENSSESLPYGALRLFVFFFNTSSATTFTFVFLESHLRRATKDEQMQLS